MGQCLKICEGTFWLKMAISIVEGIDLTSKLRKVGPKLQWNRLFSAKKSPHKFSNTDPLKISLSAG